MRTSMLNKHRYQELPFNHEARETRRLTMSQEWPPRVRMGMRFRFCSTPSPSREDPILRCPLDALC